MKRFSQSGFILRLGLTVVMIILSGCAQTKYLMKYEVSEKTALIWPSPPETPRYRYVGQLTGEFNFQAVDDGDGFGDFFVGILKAIVGLDGRNNKDPLVLQRPQTGTVDAEGRILVTDVSRHAIVVFDEKNGLLSEWKYAPDDRNFITPVGITNGAKGTVYIVDADLGVVVQLDRDGKPLKQFGAQQLQRPTGIARDEANRRIYVVDTHGHNIKIFNDDGKFIDTIGRRGTAPGEFNSPTHISFFKGKLYVTDTFNTRVQVLWPSGQVKSSFGRRGRYVGELVRPKGVTVDADGNIYVVESLHDYLLIYNDRGELLLPIGGTGSGIGQFYLPSGIWSDNRGRIYVADMFNGRIVILQYLGTKQQKVIPLS